MARATKQGVPEARRDAAGPIAVLGLAVLTALLTMPVAARCQSPTGSPTSPPFSQNFRAQPPAVDAPLPALPGPSIQPAPAAPGESLPPPRRIPDYPGASGPRMQGLPAGMLPALGTTPAPTREVTEKFSQYVKSFHDPESNLDLVMGRPRLMHLAQVPFRIQVADEKIMSYSVIGPPTEMALQGQVVGSTVLTMWFGDRDETNRQTILSWVVHVLPDPEAKDRLERAYKALEDEINRAFPDDYVHLFLVGDKLVVSGEAKDSVEAAKLLQVIRANGPGSLGTGAANIPVNQISFNLNSQVAGPDGRVPNSLDEYILQGESNIINLLRIPGEQQVMLKVTVAEVSRAAARSIGLNFSVRNDSGVQVFASNPGGGAGAAFGGAGSIGGASASINAAANLPVVLDNGEINLAIQALRTVNLARSLAEPNLVTLNGHPANFQAGGEFPVPVVTGATAVGLSGVSFVPFGVQLNFTPFITDKDRIRLQLNANVSVRDVATGANFGTGSVGNTFVPGLTTRNITTTVELREGQTLAIGGLLQTNLAGNTSRVPLLGDIPIGGQLFRNDNTSASESELVLLVTPELVHPMEPNEVPPLPGSDYFEPSDLEFYLLGRLESRRSYDYRSPVMDDPHRMAAYRHCELLYFVGPHGHSDVVPPGPEPIVGGK